MKKIIVQLLFSFVLGLFHYQASAQTIINTASVSGTWTITGSPYIVQVSTAVQPNQILTIDPGVVVQFMPDINMVVLGQLISSGTAILPITFQAFDTTGWSNNSLSTGGWGGLFFQTYNDIPPDNSLLNYCIVEDVKSTSNFLSVALTIQRSILIKNCYFHHNNVVDKVIDLNAQTNDSIEINSCIVNNNLSTYFIIKTENIWGGYTKILNCEIGNNPLSLAIRGDVTNLLIENCHIHHNAEGIHLYRGTATIRGNKIDFNGNTGINCWGCTSLIENNLICNNTNYLSDCGLTGGGGGLYISGAFPDSLGASYVVRNNVIANNLYSLNSGGGMFVFFAKATISNNHFINNGVGSLYYGNAISVWGSSAGIKSKVFIKNNLFFSESPNGIVDTIKNIFVASVDEIVIENNYLPSPVHKSVSLPVQYTLLGDTLTNSFGTTPDMISPTADNLVSTDATIANFDLLITSPCIDAGDSVGCLASSIDYLGNTRVSNWTIDIGAFEYQDLSGINSSETNTFEISLFPNPTSGELFIHSEIGNISEISVMDMTGRLVLHSEINNSKEYKVDLSSLVSGIYIVNVTTENGSFVRKIVRQ